MKQGELFGPEMLRPPATTAATAQTAPPASPAGGPIAPDALRRRLQEGLGLWVDPFTADYILRALSRGQEMIEFIASDARNGRSAFHVLSADKLRSA